MAHSTILPTFIATNTTKTLGYVRMGTSKLTVWYSWLLPVFFRCIFLHRVSGDVERKYHLRYYKTAQCVHPTDARGQCVKVSYFSFTCASSSFPLSGNCFSVQESSSNSNISILKAKFVPQRQLKTQLACSSSFWLTLFFFGMFWIERTENKNIICNSIYSDSDYSLCHK